MWMIWLEDGSQETAFAASRLFLLGQPVGGGDVQPLLYCVGPRLALK